MGKIKDKIYEIIFEADTPAGKLFDVTLLIIILISVALVMLESVPTILEKHGGILHFLEWVITAIFTLEYVLRILIVKKPLTYIFSFYGIIDLLAILPAFLGIFISGAHSLLIIRAFRLLRIFRVLKISRYSKAGKILVTALVASRDKIGVFLFTILTTILCIGTLMYLIEGEINGFTSIPKSIYWAVVTLTTVGYGDITPHRNIEYVFTIAVMLIGASTYAFIIGNIASLFSNLDSARASFFNKIDAVNHYLRSRQVHRSVLAVFDYLQNLGGKVLFFDRYGLTHYLALT